MLRLDDPLVLVELVELDIDADQVAALARDENDVALAGRLDQRLHADVGEVGDGQHVHHAPCVIGRVPVQRQAERPAHRAACAVAADHVAGAYRLDLTLVRVVGPLEPDRHRVGRSGLAGGRRVVDLNIEQPARVARLQPVRRVAHHLQVEVVHARLVQNHMRELGEPVLDILHPAEADDPVLARVVRLPERRLVDPVGLLLHALAEAEGLEHLHRPAGDAVGLAEQQGPMLLVDDAGVDVGERCQLRGERQAGRPAADDQHVDFAGQRVRAGGCLVRLRRVRDLRIAGSEPVEMELHGTVSPQLSWRTSYPCPASRASGCPARRSHASIARRSKAATERSLASGNGRPRCSRPRSPFVVRAP